MKKKIASLLRREHGENTISALIAIPLLFCILMTILDFSTFTTDRTLLTTDLRDGARTVAIFGGNGSGDNSTSQNLVNAYGAACTYGSDETDKTASQIGSKDIVSCLTSKKIAANKGYTRIGISNVSCNVAGDTANVRIGQATYCQADYEYEGFPGSALSLMGASFSSAAETPGSDGWNKGTIKVSAQSEVMAK